MVFRYFNHLQPLFGQKTRASENPETLDFTGDRERIRTAGLPLRRRSLYPAELHNQVLKTVRNYITNPEDYKDKFLQALPQVIQG